MLFSGIFLLCVENFQCLFQRHAAAGFHQASQDMNPVFFCRNDDARTTILWANAGLGIAVTPASAVHLAAHDNLSVKIIDEPSLRTRIAAIWPKGRYLSSLGESFIQALQL